MQTHAATRASQRGIALMAVCAVIFLVLGAVIAMGTVSSENLGSVALSVYEKQAIYAAEAGIQDSLLQLKGSNSWGSGGSGVIPAGFSDRAMAGQPGFSYTVTVTNNYSGSVTMAAADGTIVPAGSVYLHSTGTSIKGIQRTVSAIARQGVYGMWRNAVFGDQGVDIGGTGLVDSYNSALGPYTPQPRRGGTPQLGAWVGTNANGAGAITLGGSSYVDGSLVVGPGANPDTAVQGEENASGTVQVAATPNVLPSVSPSPAPVGPFVNQSFGGGGAKKAATYTLLPGDYGSLSVGSQAVVNLSAGRYYFNGNVDLAAGGQLVVTTGAVEIFFAGSWSSGGNTIVNATGAGGTMGSPSNLRIYGTPTATSVTMDGGGQAALLFYAPSASVTFVGTADLYGSIIGSTVHMRGTAGIHYDGTAANARFDTYLGPWTLTAFHRW